MTAIDVIKHDWRPKHRKAGDAEEDWQGVKCVKVPFMGREVSEIALGVFGDTKEGSDLERGLEMERGRSVRLTR